MSDLISRQAAIDAMRTMQTYKLFAGDDMLLIDQAGAQTELMLLPPIQPKIIKCMECIHYEADITGNPWGVCCHKDWLANNIGHNVDENGWCYRAERR